MAAGALTGSGTGAGPQGPGGPGSDPKAERAEAMARRLGRTAHRLGLEAAGRQRVLEAYATAMAPRLERVPTDHHPDFLHPARTALILMDDARVSDPLTLAAAALTETRAGAPGATPSVMEALDPEATAVASAVVAAGAARADRQVEELLALAPEGLLVAVAERLDHARHLHLREREEWAPYHARTCEAYAAVASRAHATLARRLEFWCATFSRRFLQA
jgi:(p)ppGpp synthase/HD superfamily hydrolase